MPFLRKNVRTIGFGRYNNNYARPTRNVGQEAGQLPNNVTNTAVPSNPDLAAVNPVTGVTFEKPIEDYNVPTQYREGILELDRFGNGILRPKFMPSNQDIYISSSQIRRFSLREGDMVGGQVRDPKENERLYGILKVEKNNGVAIEEMQSRPNFDDLTAIYPDKQLDLTTQAEPLSTRLIDLLAPIGKGQRGLIVSQPKAGKTTILKEIAAGLAENHPKIHIMAVLIGERPEEVTDISRSVKGETLASNFDEQPQHQVKAAEVALERAKRLVEMGKDVFILLDSITRLARAYNMSQVGTGRTMSGGFDAGAIFPAKKFFGAARCFEEGGSLTIIGTCLVDTGSRMDDLIYEEFKGTGNMELHLDRTLADRRIYPAINVVKSGTRGEERLYDPKLYPMIKTLRRAVMLLGSESESMETIIERLRKTKTNEEFLKELKEG